MSAPLSGRPTRDDPERRSGPGASASSQRQQPGSASVDWLRRLSVGASFLVMVVGGLGLCGWILGVEALKNFVPGFATMKINTAIGFALAGVSLRCQIPPAEQRWTGRLSRALALSVASLGLLTLLEYLLEVDLGIDQLLIRAPAGELGTSSPGRMAANTALSFALSGVALTLDSSARGPRFLRDLFAAAVLLIGYVALTGYSLSVTALYGAAGYSSMALPTAAGFTALSLGILALCPERGLSAILAQDNSAGAVVRKQLPFVLFLPLAATWLELEGQRAGLYHVEFGLALMTVIVALGMTSFAIWNARTRGRLETGREQAAAQFRRAIQAAPTGMLMIDPTGKIVLVNHQVEKMFGYDARVLLGQPVEMLVPESVRARHSEHRSAFVRQPVARPMGVGRDLHGLRSDGSEIPIEIGLTPLQTAEGEFVLSSIVDITERKRAEREREGFLQQLRELNAGLEKRVEERTTALRGALGEREVLLHEIHHRVKNNLSVIVSLMEMQTRLLGPGAGRSALEECQGRVHAIALIHDKLYHSKNYADVPFAEYLRGLASDVFEFMGASRSNIELSVSVADVAVSVDEAIPCGLILNELVTNALKHAFAGRAQGRVRVEFGRAEAGGLRLLVADDGVGMPPGIELRRAESLGLRLVETLARQLGGSVAIKRGGGTSVELTFGMETRET